MDKVAETSVIAPKRASQGNNRREGCLVHIYPTGPTMGQRYTLGEKPVIIGRGEDCDIRIQEHSVSRRHARLEPGADGFTVIDLQSTNGTFVNDVQTTEPRVLHDGDYLRIGNCIYRFLAGGNVEAEYHEEIYRLTIIDALTQTHNQRALLEFLDREVVRSARHGRPLSLVMFDIDWFKGINDELGHLGGDFTLRELANVVHTQVRREDLFARYGGEEFAIVLVETTLQQAVDAAERIRAKVEQHPFKFENKAFHLTISLGVAESRCQEMPASELVRLADEKLYQAKRAGRNRVAY